jgi:hypothetical protein
VGVDQMLLGGLMGLGHGWFHVRFHGPPSAEHTVRGSDEQACMYFVVRVCAGWWSPAGRVSGVACHKCLGLYVCLLEAAQSMMKLGMSTMSCTPACSRSMALLVAASAACKGVAMHTVHACQASHALS